MVASAVFAIEMGEAHEGPLVAVCVHTAKNADTFKKQLY